MKFYFSGIADKKTYQMLDGVTTNVLVDEIDIGNLPETMRVGILDSGAFRLYRKNLEIILDNYLTNTARLASHCDRIAAPDVIGNASRTLQNYQIAKKETHLKDKIFPVWDWRAPKEYLRFYLSESPLIGIGGLAGIFHNGKTPDEKKYRDRVTSELRELCEEYPKRFHIFGLNYLKAIEILKPLAYSADSSLWLRGARYAFVIFVHEKNKHLTQAPAKAIPAFANFDREMRCRASAINIHKFVSQF